MNPGSSIRRLFLFARDVGHVFDVLAALSKKRPVIEGMSIFQLVYVDLLHTADFFVTVDLLDHIRAGVFQGIGWCWCWPQRIWSPWH